MLFCAFNRGNRFHGKIILVLLLTTLFFVPLAGAQNTAMFGANPLHTGEYSSTGTTQLVPNTLLWQFPTNGWITSTPAISDGIAYVSSSDGNLYAIDINTGQKVWSKSIGNSRYGRFVSSSASVYNGIVYVGGSDNGLHAIDAKTGLEHWSFVTGGVITSSPVMDPSNAYVYFVSSDGNLYAVHDGIEVWKFRLSPGGSSDSDSVINNQIRSSPAFDPATGILYVGSWDNAVYAVRGGPTSLKGGTQVWKHATGGHVTSSPAIDTTNRLILVGCDDNQLYALKMDDNGNEAWKYRTSGDGLDRGWLIEGSPAVFNNVVYFGCGGYTFYAMDVRTQKILWTFKTSLGTETSPAIANGYVYFGSRNGNVYALDITNGGKKWEYATGDVVYSSPTVSNGVLYIGSNTGKIYALGSRATATEWQRALGGTKDDRPRTTRQTNDGGYITIGSVASNDGDVTGNHGGSDVWVVKQSSSGTIEWQKTLGGSKGDFGLSIEQTADDGYILVGATLSNDGDVSGNHGNEDVWVVKLSSSGSILWQKCLGGSGNDVGRSIRQTSDGGYIIAGFTESGNGDVTGNHGDRDVWVVKLSPAGSIEWQKCLGGSGNDEANSIQQTADGGYIIVGFTESGDGDVSGNHGGRDVWAVKLSPTGSIEWQKCLGGSGNDEGETGLQAPDGGYIISGTTTSNDGDVSGNHGAADIWIVKLSSTGSIEWQKCLGGISDDVGDELALTRDGGFVVVGSTLSQSGDVTLNHGLSDVWIARLDRTGNLLEQKSLGGTGMEYGRSIQQTADGGFIVAGATLSPEIDDGKSVIQNHAAGSGDFYMIKLKDPFQIRERKANTVHPGAFSEAPAMGYTSLVRQGLSDEKISQELAQVPDWKDPRMTDAARQLVLEHLNEYDALIQASRLSANQGSICTTGGCQSDGGMRIDDQAFTEVSGYSHGGPMETSSYSDRGTQLQFLTSHLGHAVGSSPHWIEIGIEKHRKDNGKAYVFTWDNGREKPKKVIAEVDPSIDHTFYIRIYKSGESNLYTISWDNKQVDSGTVPYLLNDVDENHEYFAPAADKFSTVSTSYFHDSIVKKPDASGVAVAYYWNDNYLTEKTKDWGPYDPVKLSRYVPSGSESYRIDTWLP